MDKCIPVEALGQAIASGIVKTITFIAVAYAVWFLISFFAWASDR